MNLTGQFDPAGAKDLVGRIMHNINRNKNASRHPFESDSFEAQAFIFAGIYSEVVWRSGLGQSKILSPHFDRLVNGNNYRSDPQPQGQAAACDNS